MCEITRVFDAPDRFPLPGETVVWRYMGFDKFISLLGLEELYFSHLTNFPDKEEMMIPCFNELRKLENWETDEGCSQTYAEVEQRCKQLAKNVFVSCWTEADGESFAQWKIYGEAGVAIKSTVDRLKQSIQFRTVDPKEVFVSRVEYKDSVDKINLHTLAGTKRKPYTFENEIRMYFDFEGAGDIRSRLGYKPVGRGLKVDLDILVESVYVSPAAKSWMTQPVIRLLEKLGKEQLTIKVVGSDIRI